MKKQKKQRRIKIAALAAAVSLLGGGAPAALAEDAALHPGGCLIAPRGSEPMDLFIYEPLPGELPEKVDLTDSFPPPGNQVTQNSCVGWAVGYAYKTYQEKHDHGWDSVADKDRQFSPSYIYNQIHINGDGGAYLDDAFELVIEQGVCTLEDMPYNWRDYTTQPTSEQRGKAYPHRAVDYREIEPGDIDSIKYVLSQNDGVVISIPIYPDLDNLSESNPIYDSMSGNQRGNHAVCLVGYDDTMQAFRFINSWGTEWGLDGYGYIAYSAMEPMDAWGYVMTDYQENTLTAPGNFQYDQSGARYTWSPVSGAEKYEISINGESHITSTVSYAQTLTLNEPYQAKVRAVEEDTDTYGPWSEMNLYYGMYGDVNKDGRISKEDVYKVVDMLFGYTFHDDVQELLADVDRDGEISYNDMVVINDYIQGSRDTIVGEKVVIEDVETYLYGDVNMDGVIDEVDAEMIKDYKLEKIDLSEKQLVLADVDGEDEVGVLDSVAIQMYYLGRLEVFPVGKYASFYKD